MILDPYCFAAWDPSELPDNGNLSVGSQFVLGTPNNTINDTYCSEDTVSPRLTFQAHQVSLTHSVLFYFSTTNMLQAPLDIKFNNSGTEGW